MIGKRTALAIVDQFKTDDTDHRTRAAELRVVAKDPWRFSLEDSLIGSTIYVPADIPLAEERTLIAHSLGQHFMHDGNRVRLKKYDRMWTLKRERQSDEFAAWLTITVGGGRASKREGRKE